MRGSLYLASVVMSVVAACGGSTDYLGESPSEAGGDLAKSSCDTAFDCGVLSIHCGTPNTATLMTGEEFYGTQDECERSLSMTYTDLFTGCAAANLTDDEASALNDCLNSGGSCPAESDFQAIADAVCSGQNPPNAPESCDQASAVLSRCSECIDNPC
jgi:hypothetical protein